MKDCVEVNDLKDVLEIEENQDFDKIDVFFGVFLCGDSEYSTFDEYQFDFDDVNIRLKKLIDRLKEKHESTYKQLILGDVLSILKDGASFCKRFTSETENVFRGIDITVV